MSDDYDPAIDSAPRAEQLAYWTQRVADLEASTPNGSRESKFYPLRQARARLKALRDGAV